MTKLSITIAQSIMNDLAIKIINGTFEGLLPSENELAQQFSASRTSVRNALQGLAGKGLISIQAKRRSVVNPQAMWNFLDYDLLKWIEEIGITPDLFEQLIVLRLMFEPSAAALAAAHATGKDLAYLEEAWMLMNQGKQEDSRPLFERGDIAFHHSLLQACHNAFLLSIGDTLKAAMILSFKQTQEERVRQTDYAVEQHRLLFEAIRLKNSDLARNLMRGIILSAATRHLPTFKPEKYTYI